MLTVIGGRAGCWTGSKDSERKPDGGTSIAAFKGKPVGCGVSSNRRSCWVFFVLAHSTYASCQNSLSGPVVCLRQPAVVRAGEACARGP